jgi:hypothetical protein
MTKFQTSAKICFSSLTGYVGRQENHPTTELQAVFCAIGVCLGMTEGSSRRHGSASTGQPTSHHRERPTINKKGQENSSPPLEVELVKDSRRSLEAF